MKQKITLLLSCLISTIAYSQSTNQGFLDWKTTDGTQNFFYKNVTKTDGLGNVYVAGATLNSAGNTDILLAKYNSAGVQLWIRQYAGSGNGADFAGGLYVTNTDVYLTGAVTTGTNLTTDVITMRYSSAGVLQWATTYNGTGNSFDSGKFIVTDGSNNVYITGGSYNASGNFDFVTIKYSSTGAQQWVSLYDYSAGLDDAGINIATMTSNVVVTGAVTSATNNYKVATLTYAQSTGSLTATNVGTATTTSSITAVTDLGKDVSGNIYIVGSTYVSGQNQNYYVQKLSNTLATIWTYTYNSASNLDDIARGVGIDASNNVYLTGYSTSSTQGRDITTVKLNSSGAQQWVQTINGTSNGDDEGADMVIDATNNIYITGYTNSSTINKADYYTVKYNTAGTKIWDIQTDGNHLNDNATNMALDSLNNVIVTGQSETAPNVFQFLTTKYVQKDVITPTDFNGETPSKNFKYFPNNGQLISTTLTAVPDIKFYTNNSYPTFYFRNNNQSYLFSRIDTILSSNDTLQRIDLNFTASNVNAKTYPMEQQKDGYLNYFLAHTGTVGVTGVLGNQKLVTTDLYTNIDLISSSNQNGIKYYFVIKPGGSLRDINIEFTGATSFSLNGTTNDLSINSSIGKIKFDRPTAYQLSATNSTIAVSGWTPDWQTNGSTNKYKFNTGAYTTSLTLIIEVDQGNSLLSSLSNSLNCKWSTYVGGNNNDESTEIKSDILNNLFISGTTVSNNFPLVAGVSVFQNYLAGSSDGFLDKYSNLGERLWSTYIGGTNDDVIKSFDFASNGDIYMVGNTNSFLQPLGKVGATNYLNQLGAIDGFIFQLSPNGISKKWLTYYGGTSDDIIEKCKFDPNGNFFIVGKTYSNNNPTTGSLPLYVNTHNDPNTTTTDGFILRFNNLSLLTWATCIGSSVDSMGANINDGFFDLDFGFNNDVYVVGFSEGFDFPIVSHSNSTNFPHYHLGNNGDAIIARFTNLGEIKWSTYMGTNGYDYFTALKIKNNKVYLTGVIAGTAFQTKNSGKWYFKTNPVAYSAASFVLFEKNDSLIHSTYLAGNSHLIGWDIALDSTNKVYLAGHTRSLNFPTPLSQSPNCYINLFNGLSDMYIYTLAPNDTNIVWATDIGGPSDEGFNIGGRVNIDINKKNELHLSGSTNSATNFPLFSGLAGITYFDNTFNGGKDASITKFYLYPINFVDAIEDRINKIVEFSIFPNPTQSIINVKLFNPNYKASYNIFNTLGQSVKQGDLNSHSEINSIELLELSTGLYILEVNQQGVKASTKFIKYE